MLGFNRLDVRLAINLFKMNFRDRYLGSALGSFWAIANPLFMLGLYTFVFGFVFKVRLPGAETTLAYVVWLISGYGPWMATSEALMTSTNSVVGAAGIVKNMAFKTELLPISSSFLGLVTLTVSFSFLLVLMPFADNPPTLHVVLLPVIIAIHFLFLISLGIWLAAINVFVRDTIQVLPNFLTFVLFMTPIFYTIGSMPVIVQRLSFANPLYQISEAYRSVLLGHTTPSWTGILYVLLLSSLILVKGLKAFRRVKGSFDSAL
jgi:lipopolysaccharide transport system permease protein